MRVSWRTNISFKLMLQEEGRVLPREIWWTGQECPWDEGLGVWSSQLQERTKLGGRVDCRSYQADLVTATQNTNRLGPCCLFLWLSTSSLVADTLCTLYPPAEARAAGLVLQMAKASTQGGQSGCTSHLVTSSVPGANPACWAACGIME